MFSFRDMARLTGRVKPIYSRGAITAVLPHLYMEMEVDTDGYHIR